MPSELHQAMVLHCADVYGLAAPGLRPCPVRKTRGPRLTSRPLSFVQAVIDATEWGDVADMCVSLVPDAWFVGTDVRGFPVIVALEVEKSHRLQKEKLERYEWFFNDIDNATEICPVLLAVDYRGTLSAQSIFSESDFAPLGRVGTPIDVGVEEFRFNRPELAPKYNAFLGDLPWLTPLPFAAHAVDDYEMEHA